MAQPVASEKELELLSKTNEVHVSIIDDDPLFRLMLQDYLLENGPWGSELFENGTDFLKNYKSNDTRKIILDYDFETGPTGLEILKGIKKINPLAKVIIVSGMDDLEKALQTIRNGATDYFLKSNETVFPNILCSLTKIFDLDKQKLN